MFYKESFFLKISYYSQENTCVLESLFNKAAGLEGLGGLQLYLKDTPTHVFFANIAKFLRTPFLKTSASAWFSHSNFSSILLFLTRINI